jgi:glucuronate isomerase
MKKQDIRVDGHTKQGKYPWTQADFLLQNKTGARLFHEVAKDLPIIDYHNHINPADLAADRQFENITQLWLKLDPYKHRLMRINGVAEKYITGESSDWDKFYHWAQTVPKTLGNPLFHWSGLEMYRAFGIKETLNANNAEAIWSACNEKLQSADFSINQIIQNWGVRWMSTSDDLLDDLQPHQQVSAQQKDMQVMPSLRGDSILAFDRSHFIEWLRQLEQQSGISIHSLEDYQQAVLQKLDHFAEAGCLLADHALDPDFHFDLPSKKEAAAIFKEVLSGNPINAKDTHKLKSYLLHFLGCAYADKQWILQLHIGAQRQTSSRLKTLAGSAGGYACIGSSLDINSLCQLMDSLEQNGQLPKIILYTLNPADYEPLASLTGSFAEDGVSGKIQLGPAWWYNDHYEGIERHLKILSSYGMLSRFIGMTTDSRSPLSFSRHEYFRRVICHSIGQWVEEGHLPDDSDLLAQLIRDISYQNAQNWILQTKPSKAHEKIKA